MKKISIYAILLWTLTSIMACKVTNHTSNDTLCYAVERYSNGSIIASSVQLIKDSADLALIRRLTAEEITYDTIPQFKVPRLKRKAENYNENDYNTFAVYTHPHTVRPQPFIGREIEKMAIWCTDSATYLAIVDELNWTSKYYHAGKEQHLRDCKTGEVYSIQGYIGYPLGQSFWIEGVAGEWHCRVLIFPPLPKHCTTIDYIRGNKKLKDMEGTTGWSHPDDILGIKVAALQTQQSIATYRETIVVE